MNYTFDIDTLSDLHKDARGFRPRSEAFWATFATADADGKQAIWDGLIKEMEDRQSEELAAECLALVNFEARIDEYVALGAGNRETAIRWILQAEGLNNEYDAGYICYCLGLSYDKTDIFVPFLADFPIESKYGEAA